MRKIIFILSVCILHSFSSCVKVKDLSDEASIDSFRIISHYPQEIELGIPTIDGNKVYIPVDRGAFLFPMIIKVAVEPSENTKDVLPGSSFTSFDSIRFGSIDGGNHKFYAISSSGKPVEYEIELVVKEQKDETDIYNFTIHSFTPENTLLGKKVLINTIDKVIDINTIESTFPLTIQASIELSATAKITNSKTDKTTKDVTLTFHSYEDTFEYTIEAENGRKQDWIIRLKEAVDVANSGSIDPNILTAVSFDKRKVSALIEGIPNGVVSIIQVDDETATLTFYVKVGSADLSQGIKIVPNWGLWANSQLLNMTKDHLVFYEYDTPLEVIILDAVSGKYKKWKILMSEGDINDILEFRYTYKDPSGSSLIELQEGCGINISEGSIILYISKYSNLPNAWPLTITPTELVVSPNASYDLAPLVFTSLDDTQTLPITSKSGKTKIWKIKLINQTTLRKEAEVTRFTFSSSNWQNLTNTNLHIDSKSGTLYINTIEEKAFPLIIKTGIGVSNGAYHTLDMGKEMKFKSFDESLSFQVIAENKTVKNWNIRLRYKPQLPNNGFEAWLPKAPGNNVASIDPTPGNGTTEIKGWATANNYITLMTTPVERRSNDSAAQIKTILAPKSIVTNLITSGTLFLGKFVMDPAQLSTPKNMTHFGIPFLGEKPIAVKIDAKYKPEIPLKKSVKKSFGSGYDLFDVEGVDEGYIWVELIHWSGDPNKMGYHGDPLPGLTILSKGEMTFTGESDWRRETVHMVDRSESSHLKPTHLVIVMASSKRGDEFIGANGSTLTVDNIELIY